MNIIQQGCGYRHKRIFMQQYGFNFKVTFQNEWNKINKIQKVFKKSKNLKKLQ